MEMAGAVAGFAGVTGGVGAAGARPPE